MPTLLAVGFFAAAALVYGVTAWTTAGQEWDQQVFLAARSRLSVLPVPAWARIPWVSSPAMWIGTATLIGLLGVVCGLRWRTMLYLAFPPSMILLARLLRTVVLDRPQLDGAAQWAAANAAPSGHATAAVAVAVVLVKVAPALLRPWIAVVVAGWATLIGVQLVVAGWHRPGDVLLAFLLVGAFADLLPTVRDDPTGSARAGRDPAAARVRAPAERRGGLAGRRIQCRPAALILILGTLAGVTSTWATVGTLGPKTTQAFALIALCAAAVLSAAPAPGRSRRGPRAGTGRVR
ncbi:phosphatase PAP2 family protein [Nocardia sp. NPDC048505]|uniref:phosphatase PAP2 family protein n=1 Tax=unclassified Nocardia TaxID=2637762 RepID=UPI0033CEEB06